MAGVELGQDALVEADLVLTQGSTNRFTFQYLDGDGDSAVPIDLTGWSARCQFRRSLLAASAWLTLVSPVQVSLNSLGFVRILIPYSITEGPDWDERDGGVWDIELTSPAGERTRFARGLFRVSHEVTRG